MASPAFEALCGVLRDLHAYFASEDACTLSPLRVAKLTLSKEVFAAVAEDRLARTSGQTTKASRPRHILAESLVQDMIAEILGAVLANREAGIPFAADPLAERRACRDIGVLLTQITKDRDNLLRCICYTEAGMANYDRLKGTLLKQWRADHARAAAGSYSEVTVTEYQDETIVFDDQEHVPMSTATISSVRASMPVIPPPHAMTVTPPRRPHTAGAMPTTVVGDTPVTSVSSLSASPDAHQTRSPLQDADVLQGSLGSIKQAWDAPVSISTHTTPAQMKPDGNVSAESLVLSAMKTPESLQRSAGDEVSTSIVAFTPAASPSRAVVSTPSPSPPVATNTLPMTSAKPRKHRSLQHSLRPRSRGAQSSPGSSVRSELAEFGSWMSAASQHIVLACSQREEAVQQWAEQCRAHVVALHSAAQSSMNAQSGLEALQQQLEARIHSMQESHAKAIELQQSSHAATLEQVHASHKNDIQKLRESHDVLVHELQQSHTAAMHQLRAELETAATTSVTQTKHMLQTTHEAELASLQAKHQQALHVERERLVQEHSHALSVVRAQARLELEEELRSMQTRADMAMQSKAKELESSWLAKHEAMVAELTSELALVKSHADAKFVSAKQRFQSALSEADKREGALHVQLQELSVQLEQTISQRDAALEQKRASEQALLEASEMRAADLVALEQARSQWTEAEARLKSSQVHDLRLVQQQLEDLRVEHADGLRSSQAQLRAEHAQAMERLLSEHAHVVEEMHSEHGHAVEEIRAEHGHAVDEMRAEHAHAVEEIRAEHAHAVDEMRAEHEKAMQAAQSELQALRQQHAQQLDAWQEQHAQEVEEWRAQQQQLEAQRDSLAAAASNVDQAHADSLSGAMAELRRSQAEASQLQAELGAAVSAREALAIELLALQSDHEKATADVTELRATIAALQLRPQCVEQSVQTDVAGSIVERLSAAVARLQENASQRLSEMAEYNEQLCAQLEIVASKLEAVEAERAELESRLSEQQRMQFEELAGFRLQQKEQLVPVHSVTLSEQLSFAQEQVEAADQRLVGLDHQLRSTHEEQLARLLAELQALRASEQQAASEHLQVVQRLSSMAAELQGERDVIQQLEDQLQVATASQTQLRRLQDDADAQIASLKEQLESEQCAAAAAVELRAEIVRLQEQLSVEQRASAEQHQAAEAQNALMQEQLAAVTAELQQQLVSEAAAHQVQLAAIATENAQVVSEHRAAESSLQQQIAELRQQLDLRGDMAEHQHAAEAAQSLLQQQVAELQEQLQSAAAAQDEQQRVLEQQKASLQAQIAELQQLLQDAAISQAEQQRAAEEQKVLLHEQLAELQRQLAAERATQLKQQRASEAQIAELQQQLREAAVTQQEQQRAAEQQKVLLQGQLAGERATQLEQQRASEAQIAELQQQLREAAVTQQEQQRAAEQQLSLLQEQLTKLQGQLEQQRASEAQIAELQQQLQDAAITQQEQQLAAEQQQLLLQEQLTELQGQLAGERATQLEQQRASEAQIAELQKQLQDAAITRDQVTELQQQLAAEQARNAQLQEQVVTEQTVTAMAEENKLVWEAQQREAVTRLQEQVTRLKVEHEQVRSEAVRWSQAMSGVHVQAIAGVLTAMQSGTVESALVSLGSMTGVQSAVEQLQSRLLHVQESALVALHTVVAERDALKHKLEVTLAAKQELAAMLQEADADAERQIADLRARLADRTQAANNALAKLSEVHHLNALQRAGAAELESSLQAKIHALTMELSGSRASAGEQKRLLMLALSKHIAWKALVKKDAAMVYRVHTSLAGFKKSNYLLRKEVFQHAASIVDTFQGAHAALARFTKPKTPEKRPQTAPARAASVVPVAAAPKSIVGFQSPEYADALASSTSPAPARAALLSPPPPPPPPAPGAADLATVVANQRKEILHLRAALVQTREALEERDSELTQLSTSQDSADWTESTAVEHAKATSRRLMDQLAQQRRATTRLRAIKDSKIAELQARVMRLEAAAHGSR